MSDRVEILRIEPAAIDRVKISKADRRYFERIENPKTFADGMLSVAYDDAVREFQLELEARIRQDLEDSVLRAFGATVG